MFVPGQHEGPRGRCEPARAGDLKPQTQKQRVIRFRGHCSIIPPREDRWRVRPARGKKTVTGSGGEASHGSVPTCSRDRRSPPVLRSAANPGRSGTLRDQVQIRSVSGFVLGRGARAAAPLLLLFFLEAFSPPAGESRRLSGTSPSPSSPPLLLLLLFISFRSQSQRASYLRCSTCALR